MIEEKHTEPLYDFLPYNAYDEYGLSMIFVFVDPNNDIATCNTRWNHDASYGGRNIDKALDKVELSKLIGKSFNDVFSGYTEEEGVLNVTFENAQELLDKGHNPDDVFDFVYSEDEGFARVELKDRWNFINKEGKIISDKWFKYVYDFYNGFAIVELSGVRNAINSEGKLVSDRWFDYVSDSNNGLFRVMLDGKHNYMDTEGNILSEEWFDRLYAFKEGFARVELNGKWNYINRKCELLSDEGFEYAWDFEDGFAKVKLNNEYYKIDQEGNILE